MPENKADRGASGVVDMEQPNTYCGQVIGMNNVTNGAVIVEKMKSGQDPLLGTGLSYGTDLMYDVSPASPPNQNPEALGVPASPSTAPYSPGDPYAGMGGF